MSCSDILLSFLADVGDDWNDSFIFPSDGTSIDVSDYLNKSDYVVGAELECSSSPNSAYSDASESADDKEFQDALDLIGDMSGEDNYGYFPFTSEIESVEPLVFEKKRKADDRPSSSKKSKKIDTDEKISSVVSLLQQYKAKKDVERSECAPINRRYMFVNSVGVAEGYLQALLGSTPATPADLLKLSSTTSTLHSRSLASLYTQAQTKKTQMKLAAWCPVNQSVSAFPENHSGIGQVAAASRAFNSAMADILSIPLMQKLHFSAKIIRSDVVSSKYGDQITAPFIWKSTGMVAMGYSQELEFNGLIRCTFVKEGVSSASLSFDACKVVRQTQTMFAPTPVYTGM